MGRIKIENLTEIENLLYLFFFPGLRYAVFGLGNSTYEHFNAMGKFVDTEMEKMGGKRVHNLGQVCYLTM